MHFTSHSERRCTLQVAVVSPLAAGTMTMRVYHELIPDNSHRRKLLLLLIMMVMVLLLIQMVGHKEKSNMGWFFHKMMTARMMKMISYNCMC